VVRLPPRAQDLLAGLSQPSPPSQCRVAVRYAISRPYG
jgi:hypothetical protein